MPDDRPPRPRDAPWHAVLLQTILTERGLATLLTLILVGALLWGGYTLIKDVRDVGQQQIIQQERILAKLDEAIEHLKRIEALLHQALTRP